MNGVTGITPLDNSIYPRVALCPHILVADMEAIELAYQHPNIVISRELSSGENATYPSSLHKLLLC